MRIYHNISALTAYNALNATSNAMQKSIKQLSTGLRINSAADDAAGLAISEKMRAQIYGMEQAITNAQDGISLIQTAEGALSETHSILQRMRELAVQAANDTMTSEDRSYIQDEIDQLKSQIDMISTSTQFNKKKLLDGSSSGIWSSTDLGTKAYIRGSLRQTDQYGETSAFEGNYKIQITATPGQAQAQKTDIFKIKHENVITDVMINDAYGAKAVRVDKLPAGTYSLSTTDPVTGVATLTGEYGFNFPSTSKLATYSYVAASAAATDYASTAATIAVTLASGTISTVKLDSDLGSAAGVVSAIQTQFDTDFGAGKVYVSVDADNKLSFVSKEDFTIQADAKILSAGDAVASTPATSNDNTLRLDAPMVSTTVQLSGADFSGASTGAMTISLYGLDSNASATVNLFGDITITVDANLSSYAETTAAQVMAKAIQDQLDQSILAGLVTVSYEAEDDKGTVFTFTAANGGTIKIDDGGATKGSKDMVGVTAGTMSEAADSLADVLTASVDADKLTQNASILFEVASVDKNNGTVTLNANANLLSTEGDVSNKVKDNIVLKVGEDNTLDLSEALGLGEADSKAFTLSLSNMDTFAVGNKFVYNVTASTDGTNATDMTVKLSATADEDWPYSWGSLTDNDVQFGLQAAKAENKEVHFRNFYLNGKNGTLYEGDIVLTTNDSLETDGTVTTGQTLTSFTSAYLGKVATSDTKLYDLDKFWNTSGVFMLEDPQTITITQGDGTKTSITLYGTDTLSDLKTKLNDAIANGLGQAKYAVSDANKFVTFVDEAAADYGLETVPGTFIIRSLVAGEGGELAFSGDEDLINALSLNVVQKSKENSFTASIYDAHTGATVASNVKVSGNTLVGVIHENVDVEFDPMSNIQASWNDNTKNFELSSESSPYTTVLHLVDNSMIFQVGANEGEDIAIDIGDMSAASLGVNRVIVTDRTSASGAISILDRAINRVSAQRAKLGAYQNALEYTVENLTTTSTNLTAAESRIRDTDMAAAMMEFVKYQILNQSGTSMLAQANQLPQSVLSLLQ